MKSHLQADEGHFCACLFSWRIKINGKHFLLQMVSICLHILQMQPKVTQPNFLAEILSNDKLLIVFVFFPNLSSDAEPAALPH